MPVWLSIMIFLMQFINNSWLLLLLISTRSDMIFRLQPFCLSTYFVLNSSPHLFPWKVIFSAWPHMFLKNIGNERLYLYDSDTHLYLSYDVKIRRYKDTHTHTYANTQIWQVSFSFYLPNLPKESFYSVQALTQGTTQWNWTWSHVIGKQNFQLHGYAYAK